VTATDLPTLPFTREPWQQNAACRGAAAALFFPGHRSGRNATTAAKAVCATCPVTDDCLEYAMRLDRYLPGVWGGTTQRDRRKMRSHLAAEVAS